MAIHNPVTALEIQEKMICRVGKVLKTVPVSIPCEHPKNKLTVQKYLIDIHRNPSRLENLPREEFALFEELGCIGAHSQMERGLSGAFLFCLLSLLDEKAGNKGSNWSHCSKNIVRPQRLETGLLGDCFKKKEGTDDPQDGLYDILTQALLQSLDPALLVKKEDVVRDVEMGNKKMLLSFPMCQPNNHFDSKKAVMEKGYHRFRLLWDFRPRGRIYSFQGRVYGIFFENCGVEVCSMEMCGNIKVKGTDMQLNHQGWDLTVDDVGEKTSHEFLPLFTAVFDIFVTNKVEQNAILEAFNSQSYQNAVSAKMKEFIERHIGEMTKRSLSPLDDLMNLMHKQNMKIQKKWNKTFQNNTAAHVEEPTKGFDEETTKYLKTLLSPKADTKKATEEMVEDMSKLSVGERSQSETKKYMTGGAAAEDPENTKVSISKPTKPSKKYVTGGAAAEDPENTKVSISKPTKPSEKYVTGGAAAEDLEHTKVSISKPTKPSKKYVTGGAAAEDPEHTKVSISKPTKPSKKYLTGGAAAEDPEHTKVSITGCSESKETPYNLV